MVPLVLFIVCVDVDLVVVVFFLGLCVVVVFVLVVVLPGLLVESFCAMAGAANSPVRAKANNTFFMIVSFIVSL